MASITLWTKHKNYHCFQNAWIAMDFLTIELLDTSKCASSGTHLIIANPWIDKINVLCARVQGCQIFFDLMQKLCHHILYFLRLDTITLSLRWDSFEFDVVGSTGNTGDNTGVSTGGNTGGSATGGKWN